MAPVLQCKRFYALYGFKVRCVITVRVKCTAKPPYMSKKPEQGLCIPMLFKHYSSLGLHVILWLSFYIRKFATYKGLPKHFKSQMLYKFILQKSEMLYNFILQITDFGNYKLPSRVLNSRLLFYVFHFMSLTREVPCCMAPLKVKFMHCCC